MSNRLLEATANKLVDLCRQRRDTETLDTLYHPNAVSVEAMTMPGSSNSETVGVQAIKGKHDWYYSAFEVHGATVDGPYLHGDDRFGVIFEIDATNNQTGERSKAKELAIYFVNDEGKIIREEFFYNS